MMGRAWKPGDVGVAKFGGRSMFIQKGDTPGWVLVDGSGANAEEADPIRPLVVIDPEDREQVARLADAFCYARWDHSPGSSECDPLTRSSMQAALREFADPKPPKPEEPTGLGAVVEDAIGRRWTRADEGTLPWHGIVGGGATQWENYHRIDAVKVLSEGVQP